MPQLAGLVNTRLTKTACSTALSSKEVLDLHSITRYAHYDVSLHGKLCLSLFGSYMPSCHGDLSLNAPYFLSCLLAVLIIYSCRDPETAAPVSTGMFISY